MANSEQYRREVLKDLAQGNVESLDNIPVDTTNEYQSFDDFAQRTTTDQRRQLFNQSSHPERIPPSEIEPELQKAISQIKPNERDDVARAFFKQLKERGLEDKRLEQQLNLSTHHSNRMTADDVSKLASFAYHNHPDVFREVLAEQPGIMKFLSNPIVAGIIGIAAAKWLGSRK
ncbi:hypothetical protein H6G54_25485 [Anabaena cylindrica FACHB-243]|uniref:Uncharacterized protein n=1 Tax=Anabaena cylindrica (strain ATCC 27899 / PCC 7122) TaxID=272123 RepID=K9ZFH0_ANACC|nr:MULTISPECIES: hypothetical protein [Anabaena]AFZ57322.1 hypothetical protein Anacy_1832 [Anabaena cylindrica PCC 7122]MBD2420990.1 hypothetical protein [Anabaena cylindrica FACHB-243]MBY5280694.1 hypothetical protein [Anabaena sp. CCAP 1446/1C]MBY5306920.1 hypothetical protein [Anabaena sp. CCAP 1446/1C]MCM2405743.1 hypothetical protein [Anabaena sp. CCAP 1446/1C]